MIDKEKRLHYFKKMEIPLWILRENGNKISKETAKDDDMPRNMPEKSLMTREQKFSTLNWQELRLAVNNCKACDLYKTRSNPVFGVGNLDADLLVIGEAPGANEDKQGEPFVGRGGQLLTNLLSAIGF